MNDIYLKLDIKEVISFLKNILGPKIFLVGGAVRDTLLRREIRDLDFSYEGNALEAAKIFKSHFKNFKILSKKFDSFSFNYNNFEVSLNGSRKDLYEEVLKIEKASILEDLSRRDFTINSIAVDSNFKILDPLKGLDDLNKKLIRVIVRNSFEQDSSRIIRALRYKYILGFNLEENTKQSILKMKKIEISYRFKKELDKTIELYPNIVNEEMFKEMISKLKS